MNLKAIETIQNEKPREKEKARPSVGISGPDNHIVAAPDERRNKGARGERKELKEYDLVFKI